MIQDCSKNLVRGTIKKRKVREPFDRIFFGFEFPAAARFESNERICTKVQVEGNVGEANQKSENDNCARNQVSVITSRFRVSFVAKLVFMAAISPKAILVFSMFIFWQNRRLFGAFVRIF